MGNLFLFKLINNNYDELRSRLQLGLQKRWKERLWRLLQELCQDAKSHDLHPDEHAEAHNVYGSKSAEQIGRCQHVADQHADELASIERRDRERTQCRRRGYRRRGR